MHEIITIQLGNYANYVGTHFWNIQESYFTYSDTEPSLVNHDIHFRAGEGVGGVETYTPRALIYDLKGGFGSLRQTNPLYEEERDPKDVIQDRNLPWDKKKELRRLPEVSKNDFQRSLDEGTDAGIRPTDGSIRNWSDFNTMFYHPRSMIKLNEFELDNNLTPFDSFDAGKELFRDIDREYGILDQDFRHFAEECDLLSGVQTFMTIDDGWGGYGAEYISALKDDFPKTSLWTWGIERDSTHKASHEPREVQTKRVLTAISSLSAVVTHSSCYVPVFRIPSTPLNANPFVHFDQRFFASNWRTAALTVAALETCTLPMRLKGSNGLRFRDIFQMLDPSERRKIAGISLSQLSKAALSKMEDQETSGDEDEDLVHDALNLSWEETSGGSAKQFSCVDVCRGTKMEAPIARDRRNRLERYRYTTELRFPLIPTWPDIFIRSPDSEEENSPAAAGALGTRLSTSAATAKKLKSLRGMVRRVLPIHEDREGVENDFAEMAEAYEEGWTGDSDEGDDF